VVEHGIAVVALFEREGGAGDGLAHAHAVTEALDERRLAGAEVTGQQDEVAAPDDP
jgi:hypothetical protein